MSIPIERLHSLFLAAIHYQSHHRLALSGAAHYQRLAETGELSPAEAFHKLLLFISSLERDGDHDGTIKFEERMMTPAKLAANARNREAVRLSRKRKEYYSTVEGRTLAAAERLSSGPYSVPTEETTAALAPPTLKHYDNIPEDNTPPPLHPFEVLEKEDMVKNHGWEIDPLTGAAIPPTAPEMPLLDKRRR